jgi:uncharacterized membrane protein YgaE (UPF0421/DUF939 family)
VAVAVFFLPFVQTERCALLLCFPEIDCLYEQRREAHEKYKQALANYHEEQKHAEKEMQQMKKAEQRRDESRLTKISAERTR